MSIGSIRASSCAASNGEGSVRQASPSSLPSIFCVASNGASVAEKYTVPCARRVLSRISFAAVSSASSMAACFSPPEVSSA